VGMLEGQRRATPDRPALTDGLRTWTYDELHRAASALTRSLVVRSIVRGDTVGVCLPRSLTAIAAMLGVWGAGATYAPLDPDYPQARLAAMVDQAGIGLVVGEAHRVHGIDPDLAVIEPAIIVPGPRDDVAGPVEEPDADDVAYVLFTSGSSGRPKAVEVAHRSLLSVVEWMGSVLSTRELAVTVTSISFSFDPFVLEVLGPLSRGGLVRAIPSALALADIDSGATFLASTPSVLRELLRAGRLPTTLRTVISGGEVLPPDLATELLTTTSVSRLINTYGPTEATVLATASEVTLPVERQVPIGYDLPGARVLLLDDDLRDVALGAIGEICIFGPQVARGYRGDPQGTADRFLLVDRPDADPVRIYRTGDLARRNDGGAIEFCGRKDRQLKLRGFRIEPGEIEDGLCRHPLVDQAMVTAAGEGPHIHLVAHVTSPSHDLDPSELRVWLRDLLPHYMVPTHIVVMPAFPTTTNGKVAVDLLPPWQASIAPPRAVGAVGADGVDAGEEPDPTVTEVAALTREILGFEGTIHPTDDVLEDLGASSLALFQLLTRIEQTFSCTFEIGRILEDTTVAGLAAMIGQESGSTRFLSVNAGGTKRPVFMVHAYLGTALRYRRLGSYLSPDRPMVGIQIQEFDHPEQLARTSIAQMADETVARIRSVQPVGPYLLGGHSAGGLVAYEAARRLAAEGEEVPVVILIDSPVPRSTLHYLWAEAVLNWPDVRSGDRADRRRRSDAALVGRSSRFRRERSTDRVSSAVTRSYRASKDAVRRYRPGHYRGDLTILRTSQGVAMALGDRNLGWKRVAGGSLHCVDIPGLHNSIFEVPQVEFVGRELDRALERADRGHEVTDLGALPLG
jgi:amino acid adenylation domain-containing protein